MNFKRIEVFGFKSFADKVCVDFNEGITGIVGPNGCGKSNVADAIRWVLGEQSVKLLRGKSMQDVIFKGSERRKPLSFCEVSLVFDNHNKIFPTMDFEEIVVTRKLFRSGESEYYLNRTPCRLRDIQEMIRDTGLGREGYSIVGQGRIDEIVNARPKDRRSIFEDAAGILKYKQRKIESERKLARTDENIERLGDIIAELDRQLGPLRRQSEDAKKYLQLYDALRALEANDYLYRYENADGEKTKLQLKIADVNAQLRALAAETEKAENEYADKTKEIGDIDDYINDLHKQQTELAVYVESVKGQGSTLAERIANLKSMRAEYADRIALLEDLSEQKSNEIVDLVSRAKMAEEEEGELSQEYRTADARYLKLTDEILEREKQLESKNVEMLKAVESIGDIKADLGKLMTEREITLSRIAELDGEIDVIKRGLEEEERQKAALEEGVERARRDKTRLAQHKNEVLSEVNRMTDDIEKAREDAQSLTGEIRSLETRKRMLEDWKADYGGFGPAVQNLMQAAKSNARLDGAILGVVAELIKVPKQLETAVETALGAAMQNIVTANEADAKYCIEFLKQNRLGRLTFLPLTSFKSKELDPYLQGMLREKGCVGVCSKLISYDAKYERILGGLLGRVVVCEDLDSAIAVSKRYNYAVKIVTLAGDVINPSGSLTGGSKKSETSNLLGQEREIENTQRALAEKQKRFAECKKLLTDGLEDLAELKAQLAEYEENVKNAEVAYATEAGKLDKICSRIQTMLEELEGKTLSRSNIGERVKIIDMAIAAADKKGGDVLDLRATVDEEAARSKAEFDEKKREKDVLGERLTALRVDLNALASEREKLTADAERVRRERAAADEEIAEKRTGVKSLDERIYQAENNLNNAVVSEEDKKRYEQLIEKISSLDEHKKQLNERVAEINAIRKDLSAQNMQALEIKVKAEAELDKIDEKIEESRIHMEEEYGLNYDSCLSYRRADFDPQTASAEINKLSRSLKALGPVNVEAIGTYEEVGARYEEMTGQRDDLLRTREDLIKIIDDLAKEMKSRFDSEFEKINKNFRLIFKELFGGGHGELIVEDVEEGEDPLDAGIEIMAEPPGKRLGSITLFSGGEKALIAIAILFAILRLKAMPFCVLDEIEAALDDANVALFAKYLGRFSNETQFIVITHRKPTMELADRLYGVTMQEKGISKMVAVSLEDAVKQSESK